MRRKDGSGWGGSRESLGQKGYGRMSDSGAVRSGVGHFNPQQSWGLSWSDDDDDEGPIIILGPKAKPPTFRPPLIIVALYDGESYELEEFFHRRIQLLDAASGKSVHILDVG